MNRIHKIVGTLALVTCAVVGTKLQLDQTLGYDLRDQSLAYLNAYMTSEKKGSGSNTEKGGSNTEKGTSLSEWWGRKDWTCIDVECIVLFAGTYNSNSYKRVADGTGTHAHFWECQGCNNRPYQIKNPEDR